MDNKRITLTKKQLDDLSCEMVDKLHKIPLYDIEAKKSLASNYIEKSQGIILKNLKKISKDHPNDNFSTIIPKLLAEYLDDNIKK